jgi:hypothetical protein
VPKDVHAVLHLNSPSGTLDMISRDLLRQRFANSVVFRLCRDWISRAFTTVGVPQSAIASLSDDAPSGPRAGVQSLAKA